MRVVSYRFASSSPTALSYGTGFIYSLPQLLAEHWASHSMTRHGDKSLAQMRSPVVGKATNEGCGPTRPMHSFDQMKPRTVYEKAVRDFAETAQQLARLDQHFRQASFAEFKMLMAFDDEPLKLYGLPKPMVERALIKSV